LRCASKQNKKATIGTYKMPTVKFYYAPGACSLAPHILLRETGVTFEAIANKVDGTGTTFIEGFATINPKMRVPVITIDQDTITESPAVLTAIARLAPEMYLIGRTPLDTLRVYEWMNWISGTLHGQGFGALFRPERYSDDPAAFNGIQEKGRKHVGNCFDEIEGRLDGIHAVGGVFTAVDPYLFVFYRWGNDVGFDMKGKYPRYTALVLNLVKRPAVRATLKAENIQSAL
jgi:glutathione S-transferase